MLSCAYHAPRSAPAGMSLEETVLQHGRATAGLQWHYSATRCRQTFCHVGVHRAYAHLSTCSACAATKAGERAAQIVMESRVNCAGARRHLAAVKAAAPEVLTAIRTKQLAQELLLYKEDHLQDIAKTGAAPRARARARGCTSSRGRGCRARSGVHVAAIWRRCRGARFLRPSACAMGRWPS